MPTAGDQLPPDVTALARRIAGLEREIRELRAAKRASATAVNSGQFGVVNPASGNVVLSTGQWDTGRFGTDLRRHDGSHALTVSGQRDDVPDMIRVYARGDQQSPVIMDDAYTDRFLGRPSLGMPWQPTSAAWNYTSSSVGVAWLCAQRVQCPVLYLASQTSAPSGTNASLELVAYIGGTAVTWDTWTVTGSGPFVLHETVHPMHQISHFQHVQFELHHWRTSGTGSIYTNVIGGYQRNTFTTDEVPDPPVT